MPVMPHGWRRALVPVAAALLVYLTFHFERQYPWQLALLSALSVGALVYSTLRTLERRFWSQRRWTIDPAESPDTPETPPRGSAGGTTDPPTL